MSRHRIFGPLVAAIALVVMAAPALAAEPQGRYDHDARQDRVAGSGTAAGPGALIAPQTAPGANGKIVYARSPHGGWPARLWLMDSNGDNEVALTTYSVGIGDNWPEWSPGGTLIAFSRDMTASETDGGEDIFTIRPDGTGLKRLTNTTAREYSPVFSPDGSRIAFTSTRAGNPELYTMNIDGSDVRRLTNNPAYDSQADWSPDGTRIAFVSDRTGQTEIYTIKPDGTGLDPLTSDVATGDFAPNWSPDGTKIAFNSDRNPDGLFHIYSMTPLGGNPTWIDTTIEMDALRPVWSPNGTAIAFDSASTPTWDIFWIDAATSAGLSLATSADDELGAAWQPIPAFPLVDARFSTFKADIEWVYAEGITVGCSAERYCPNDTVTRGQMATFLVRALNLPPTATDYFTDDETSSHEVDINRVRAAGITSGCGPTTYCPLAVVTREQMATFLAKGFDLPATATDYFTDDETSSHEANINKVRAANITTGCTATTYCPKADVTRGQMAAFLRRALE